MTQIPTLSERIARIYELDAKRTQGRWRHAITKPWADRRHHVDFGTVQGVTLPKTDAECNAAFIAAAPEMVQIIRELKGELEGYHKLLCPEKMWQALDEPSYGDIKAERNAMRPQEDK